jgi:hypothetical protein
MEACCIMAVKGARNERQRRISTGQTVPLIRNGQPHGPKDPQFGKLSPGARILEIIDSV